MSLSITFRRAARTEFIEAAARYEAQQKNLGVEFITEIERCVALAAEQPEIFATVHKDIRRVTAHRFPFSVYFRVVKVRTSCCRNIGCSENGTEISIFGREDIG